MKQAGSTCKSVAFLWKLQIRGDWSKKTVTLSKKLFFLRGVHIGQKNIYFSQKTHFWMSTINIHVQLRWKLSICWWYWSKKTFILVKKNLFMGLPAAPLPFCRSILAKQTCLLVKKNIFLVKKNIFEMFPGGGKHDEKHEKHLAETSKAMRQNIGRRAEKHWKTSWKTSETIRKPYYHIIKLSDYHTVILSFCHTVILSSYHTTVLSCRHSAVIVSSCHSIMLSRYHIIIPSYCQTIMQSYYHTIYHAIMLSCYDTSIPSY